MKHLITIIILVLSITVIFSTAIHAQNTVVEKTTEVETLDQKSPAPQEQTVTIDYTLPYPGILTDHPLYILKSLRDQIMQIFIVDPVKRVEFQILQSDKFFSMGISYVSNNQWEKAQDVFNRSTNATLKAIEMIRVANQGVSKIPVMTIEHIQKSIGKHQEMLQVMAVSRSGSQKDILMSEFERASDAGRKVKQVLNP